MGGGVNHNNRYKWGEESIIMIATSGGGVKRIKVSASGCVLSDTSECVQCVYSVCTVCI